MGGMMELLLIDLGSLYWRKWFALRSQMMTLSEVVNRVDFMAKQYEYVVVCADSPTNWRTKITAELEPEKRYKANRPRKEPEAILTLTDTEERLAEIGYPVVKCDGYEADDVIAALVRQSACPTFISSEDKDLYQLIDSRVTQLTLAGEMTPDACKRKFGVYPEKIRDLIALIGDASDNIAGCPKVGQVIGGTLLDTFGSIEGIKTAPREELLKVRKVGATIADNIAAWDPTVALELVRLATDCPVNLAEVVAGYTPQKIDDEITFG